MWASSLIFLQNNTASRKTRGIAKNQTNFGQIEKVKKDAEARAEYVALNR